MYEGADFWQQQQQQEQEQYEQEYNEYLDSQPVTIRNSRY